MRSEVKLALHNVEVSGEEQARIKRLAVGNGSPRVSHGDWNRFFGKLNRGKQTALITQWLTDGTIKEVRSYDSDTGRLSVVLKGGYTETLDV